MPMMPLEKILFFAARPLYLCAYCTYRDFFVANPDPESGSFLTGAFLTPGSGMEKNDPGSGTVCIMNIPDRLLRT